MKLTDKLLHALLSFSLIIISGCDLKEKDDHKNQSAAEENDHHREKYLVKISPAEMEEFGIETSIAGPGLLELQTALPGEAVIPPDNLAHIHSRFPGIVKEVRKHIGDFVKKGETLAIIESNESLSEYAIKSLISGQIIEKHFTIGELVDDKSHGFVIADLSLLWIYLQAYQKDLPFLENGQKVTIYADDHPELCISQKIEYISPVIDEKTRTAKVRIAVRNAPPWLKPGLFVTGYVTLSRKKVNILIPKTAVETLNGEKVVFVYSAEGYLPRQIRTGRENQLSLEIVSGLNAGEKYVSKGGFTLKSELQKGNFGGGEHNH
jgi:cobalt-zinc-cadmium efflux system membrane fusion protein